MKLLVACECSGVVRDAFRAIGVNATSCDLQPSDTPGPHLQCDVLSVLSLGWDMMIAHPPCTDLAVTGARWFAGKGASRQNAALAFVFALRDAPIPHICIENPVGILSTHWRKPDQYIQPWQFGEATAKKTGLWLKNLPLLRTPVPKEFNVGKLNAVHMTPGGKNQAKKRSRTFPLVAKAMAEQWGPLLLP